MNKQTGGQAFPRQQWEYDGQGTVLQYQEEGMTLRDYFAAKAMASMCAVFEGNHQDEAARRSYAYADAMLRAREAS